MGKIKRFLRFLFPKNQFKLIIYLLFEVIFMDKTVISVEQMRRSDAYTIENFVPSKELMYRAANGVFESFMRWENKKIAIDITIL